MQVKTRNIEVFEGSDLYFGVCCDLVLVRIEHGINFVIIGVKMQFLCRPRRQAQKQQGGEEPQGRRPSLRPGSKEHSGNLLGCGNRGTVQLYCKMKIPAQKML